MGNRLRTAVILTVASVWAANMIAPIFIKGYEASPELSVAFMAILGLLTAGYRKPPDGD